MEKVTFQSERLSYRPLGPEDLETPHRYAGDGENAKYMLFLPNESLEETREFLQDAADEWEKESPSYFEFAILLEGLHIGAVSLYLNENRKEAELGWILHREYQGKGYGAEAAKAAMDFAIDRLNVKKIVAHCDQRNIPSKKVMEKIGLRLENAGGTRRYKDSDADVPEFMYSLEV